MAEKMTLELTEPQAILLATLLDEAEWIAQATVRIRHGTGASADDLEANLEDALADDKPGKEARPQRSRLARLDAQRHADQDRPEPKQLHVLADDGRPHVGE